MKKRIWMLLLAVLLVLSACNPKDTSKESLGEATGALKEGYVAVNEKGDVLDKIPEGKKVLNWYSDPSCGACINLTDISKEFTKEVLEETNGVIKYHFLNFLDGDDIETGHSTTAAAYLYAMADKQPKLFNKFYEKMMNFDWLSKKPSEESEKDFAERTFIEIGGSKDNFEKLSVNIEEYKKMVSKKTEGFMRDVDLASKSPTGQLYTPFVVADNADKGLDLSAVEDIKEAFKEQLKK